MFLTNWHAPYGPPLTHLSRLFTLTVAKNEGSGIGGVNADVKIFKITDITHF